MSASAALLWAATNGWGSGFRMPPAPLEGERPSGSGWWANTPGAGTPAVRACMYNLAEHDLCMMIPVTAALVVGAQPSEVTGAVVWRGTHAEIAVTDLEEACGPEIARSAEQYWKRTTELWESLTGEAVVLQRTLLVARQTDGKEGRTDLAGELEAMMAVPALAAVCDAMLEQEVVESGLTGCEVERDGNTTVVRVYVSSLEWPDELGGPPCPGETRRLFELTANHAKWRDRRVRRLQALRVEAEELWAAPLLAT